MYDEKPKRRRGPSPFGIILATVPMFIIVLAVALMWSSSGPPLPTRRPPTLITVPTLGTIVSQAQSAQMPTYAVGQRLMTHANNGQLPKDVPLTVNSVRYNEAMDGWLYDVTTELGARSYLIPQEQLYAPAPDPTPTAPPQSPPFWRVGDTLWTLQATEAIPVYSQVQVTAIDAMRSLFTVQDRAGNTATVPFDTLTDG
jgi:hypothetical protein